MTLVSTDWAIFNSVLNQPSGYVRLFDAHKHPEMNITYKPKTWVLSVPRIEYRDH